MSASGGKRPDRFGEPPGLSGRSFTELDGAPERLSIIQVERPFRAVGLIVSARPTKEVRAATLKGWLRSQRTVLIAAERRRKVVQEDESCYDHANANCCLRQLRQRVTDEIARAVPARRGIASTVVTLFAPRRSPCPPMTRRVRCPKLNQGDLGTLAHNSKVITSAPHFSLRRTFDRTTLSASSSGRGLCARCGNVHRQNRVVRILAASTR